MRKSKFIKIVTIVTVGLLCVFLSNLHSIKVVLLKHEAADLIEKIEEYKKRMGVLPENLNQLGLSDCLEGPIFYRKESSVNYVIWFGVGLGDSMIFDSVSRAWRLEG